MNQLIASLPDQIREAIKIGENTPFTPTSKKITAVLVCGLGGSGIGGKIVGFLLKEELPVPFLCINDYDIPNWVNENTLVIASSYSGNTEETLWALDAATARNSEIAVITSGGSVLEKAKAHNWNSFVVPGGEQPRAMLAFSVIQQLYILWRYGLINDSQIKNLKTIPDFIEQEEQAVRDEAVVIATAFAGKRPIIYAGNDFEGVAVRWRQQINENGKELCWHHVFPEMTHNELVGWTGGSPNEVPIFLSSDYNHPRTNYRWKITKDVIANYTPTILETNAKGESKLAHNFYLIHLGDWVSYFISQIKNIDPNEVDIITHLKSEMAKMK